MKILALVAVLVALVLPASASAAVSSYYTYDESGNLTYACVTVTPEFDPGSAPIDVSFTTPSGRKYYWKPRDWRGGTHPRSFCIHAAAYLAEGGYGWMASASVRRVSLGSTVF